MFWGDEDPVPTAERSATLPSAPLAQHAAPKHPVRVNAVCSNEWLVRFFLFSSSYPRFGILFLKLFSKKVALITRREIL